MRRARPATWLIAVLALVAAPLATALLQPRAGPIMRILPVGRALRPSLPSLSLAIDTHTHRLFVSNGDTGTLYTFDARDGAMLHSVTLGPAPIGRRYLDLPMGGAGGIGAPPPLAVDDQRNHVFTFLANHEVMLDARGGAVLDTINVSGFAPLLLDGVDGRLIAPAYGIIAVLDARTNALLRILHTGVPPVAVAVDAPDRRLIVAGVATRGIVVSIYDARRLVLLRRLRMGRQYNLYPSFVAAPEAGRVVIGVVAPTGNLGTLFILDPRRGRILRTLSISMTGMALYATDTVHKTLIIADGAGALRIVTARGRQAMQTAPLPGAALALVLDSRRDRAFVLSAAAHNVWLTTLSSRNGSVLHTLALPVSATALALDDRAGHLFVLDEGGLEQLPDPWQTVPRWLPRGLARWLPFLPRPGASTRVAPPRVLMLDERRVVT